MVLELFSSKIALPHMKIWFGFKRGEGSDKERHILYHAFFTRHTKIKNMEYEAKKLELFGKIDDFISL